MNTGKGFLDDASLEFPCPKCGATVHTTIGAGRRNQSIQCPGGHTINVEGSDLDRETKKVEKSLDDLRKKFR